MTTDVSFRAGGPGDAPLLTELALRAKSRWGYDSGFLEAARADLTITEEAVLESTTVVCTRAERVIGFYGLVGEPPDARRHPRSSTGRRSRFSKCIRDQPRILNTMIAAM